MSALDYVMPHRLLVNRSLRKASDDLHSRIEEYQLEYDREIERCTAEIEQAKVDKESAFESAKSSLINELSKDSALFEKVHEGLIAYADLFFRRQCLNKVCEIKRLEKQVLIEYGDFLTEQMRLIGEEIDVLEVRKDRLALQARVNDIVELIGLSGCDIAIDSDDNAQTLLAKVVELIESTEDSDWIKKQSLRKLRFVLQERVDLLPVIQYITWTIQQKIQLSRQLSTERRKANADKTAKANELREVTEKIDAFTHMLDEHARTVREYWAIPITRLNIQISFLHRKLSGIFARIKDAGERIEHMKRVGSDDSSTWERLWREKNDLKDQIPQVKAEIESLKSERQQWFSRQRLLYSLCKRNNLYLISDNKSKESDESRIINCRLTELYKIEEEANKREEERFKQESALIQERRKEKVEDLSAKIASAGKNQADKSVVLRKAAQQLSSSKSRDARFFLLKVFSDTEEVTKAKQALKVAEEQKKSADSRLSNLKNELAKVMADFDRQVESCRPIPYRPTAAEKEEIQKLENRKVELMDRQIKNKSALKEEYL